MTTYKNPWYRPFKEDTYGPERYTTNAKPTEYRGYLIFERIEGLVWDVVRDGVCITQRAGPNGAMDAIDLIIFKNNRVK